MWANLKKPQTTVIDEIFKLQFSTEAELEIYKDSVIESYHTNAMNAT